MKVYRAGIPARYGGRASSVADIRLKEGNNQKFSGDAAISPLVLKVSLEIPVIKNKMSIYLSGRRSFVDLFMPLIMNNSNDNGDNSNVETKVYFYDASFKLNYKANDNNRLFLSAYSAKDLFYDKYENGNNYDKLDINWGDYLASLRWNHIFSPKLFSNLSLITSNYDFSYKLTEYNDHLPENQKSVDTNLKNGISSLEGKYYLSFYPSQHIKIEGGLGIKDSKYKSDNFETSVNNTDDLTKNIQHCTEYHSFININSKLSGKLTLNTGLRFSGARNYGPMFKYEFDPRYPPSENMITKVIKVDANKTNVSYLNLEPRVSLNYKLNGYQSLKLAYDKLVQYAHRITNSTAVVPFDVWKGVNHFLPPTITNQFTIGSAIEKSNWNATLDLYYKGIKNFLDFIEGKDLTRNQLLETTLLPAKAYSYGLELSVQKEFKKVHFSTNYTYSKTLVKTISGWGYLNTNGGNYYPASYDRPHNAKVQLSYLLSERMKIHSNFVLQSGRPLSLPTGKVGQMPVYSHHNAYRLPLYHRLDLSLSIASKNKPNKKIRSEWVFSVLNVYARKNSFSYFAQRDNTDINKIRMKNFSVLATAVPSFSFNIYF